MDQINNNFSVNANLIVKFTIYQDVNHNELYAITLADGTRHIIPDKNTFDELKEASGKVTYKEAIITDKLTVGNIEDVEQEINNIKDFSDVKDVVVTYEELLAYDTSTLNENDIIEVLSDSTHNDAISMYRWGNNEFTFIGSIGPFYTKSQSDERFELKLPEGDREYLSNLRASMPNVNDTTIALTYSQIKTLKTNNQLIAGRTYRITDYSTMTIDTETQSAGNDFDIILKANSTNSFEPICSAHVRSETNYFEQNYVSQWILWYNFDNDTSLCSWVDNTCKGYIYRMIDEYNNDLPYDFKNIQFKRYKIASVTYPNNYSSLIGMYLGNTSPFGYTIDNNDFVWRYTFSSDDALEEDLSNKHIENSSYPDSRYVKQVKIGARLQDSPYRGKLQLNNNVIISSCIICDVSFGNQTHTNTIQVAADFSYNYFDSMFRNNLIFVTDFNHVTSRECFERNLIGSGTMKFCWNILGDHTSNNIIQGAKNLEAPNGLSYVIADSPNNTFLRVFIGNWAKDQAYADYSIFITNAINNNKSDMHDCNIETLGSFKLDHSQLGAARGSFWIGVSITGRPMFNVSGNDIEKVSIYFDQNNVEFIGWKFLNSRGTASSPITIDFRGIPAAGVLVNNAIKTYDRQLYTIDGSLVGFLGVLSYEIYDSTNNFKTTYVWSSVMDGLTPTWDIILKNLTRHEVVNRIDSNYKVPDDMLIDFIDSIDTSKDHSVETDNNVAYQKTLPSGTIGLNVLEIGGMSYKCNNLISLQDKASTTTSGITYKVENGVISVSGSISDSYSAQYLFIEFALLNTIPSGTYSINWFNDTTNANLYCYNGDLNASGDYTLAKFLTTTNASGSGNMANGISQIRLRFEKTYTYNITIKPMLVSGSTIPTEWQPYFTGIRHSAVSSVVANSRNMFNKATATTGYYVNYQNGNLAASADNTASDFIDVLPNTTYFMYQGGLVDGEWGAFYDANKQYISGSSTFGISVGGSAFTTPTNAYYFRVTVRTAYIDKTCINLSDSANGTYTPYVSPITKQIPAEIQALTGYGYGVNSVSNYIDLKNNEFNQDIGRVDLGTLTYSYNNTSFYALLPLIKSPANNTTVANILVNGYTSVAVQSILDDTTLDNVVGLSTAKYIRFRNLNYTDADTFKTAMSGVYLYYQLASTVVTDISSYIDSDFKSFETNGNYAQIEFVNEHNADMPNTIEELVEYNS